MLTAYLGTQLARTRLRTCCDSNRLDCALRCALRTRLRIAHLLRVLPQGLRGTVLTGAGNARHESCPATLSRHEACHAKFACQSGSGKRRAAQIVRGNGSNWYHTQTLRGLRAGGPPYAVHSHQALAHDIAAPCRPHLCPAAPPGNRLELSPWPTPPCTCRRHLPSQPSPNGALEGRHARQAAPSASTTLLRLRVRWRRHGVEKGYRPESTITFGQDLPVCAGTGGGLPSGGLDWQVACGERCHLGAHGGTPVRAVQFVRKSGYYFLQTLGRPTCCGVGRAGPRGRSWLCRRVQLLVRGRA